MPSTTVRPRPTADPYTDTDVVDARARLRRNTLAYARGPALAGLLMDAAARIAAAVPAARLRFRRSSDVAVTVFGAL